MMHCVGRMIKCGTAVAVAATGAAAGETLRLSTEGAAVRLEALEPEEAGSIEEGFRPAARYGAEGTQWILFGGGVAHDFSSNTDININGAWSVFIVDDVEWLLELGAWYHAQEGGDAASINPVMEFRWHFYNRGDTSLFLNGGIGVLAATDNVPSGGTSFDFTPRIGVGLTQRLTDAGTRLVAGVRWHHISNARFNGENRNPSRDAPMVYAQVAMPF